MIKRFPNFISRDYEGGLTKSPRDPFPALMLKRLAYEATTDRSCLLVRVGVPDCMQ